MFKRSGAFGPSALLVVALGYLLASRVLAEEFRLTGSCASTWTCESENSKLSFSVLLFQGFSPASASSHFHTI